MECTGYFITGLPTTGSRYRVYSLCLRLLGYWLTKKDNDFFLKVKTEYSFLLSLIISGLRAVEAPIRCASLEAFQGIISTSQGAQWLLENDSTESLISLSLMDDSIYVVSKGCDIYLLIIKQQSYSQEHKKLYQRMNPSNQIKQILESYQQPISLIMASLEYCWIMVNMCHNPIVYQYLIDNQLLPPLTKLLTNVDNRIVRKRIIEILSTLFQHSSSPYHLLMQTKELGDKGTKVDSGSYYFMKLYEQIQSICQSLIQSKAVDDTCIGIELIQTNIKLLHRILKQKDCNKEMIVKIQNEIQEVTQFMIDIIECCCDRINSGSIGLKSTTLEILDLIKKAPRPLFVKKKILYATIQTLQSISSDFQLQDVNLVLNSVLFIFSDGLFINDQRLLKSCLQIIIQLLHHYSIMLSLNIINQVMVLLIERMSDIQMDSRNLVLVLSTFNELLGHSSFKTVLMQQSLLKSFMDGVRIKFVDMEWDVRDAMIEFVGNLFKPTLVSSRDNIEKINENNSDTDIQMKNKMEFAITAKLPLLVIERINDHEPYVRASALNTVQLMMKTGPGWLFIQQHEKLRELSHHLPILLYDTEGFVRRATLDAMICLVTNRSCEGLNIMQEENEEMKEDKDKLGSNTFAMLLNDDDIEVRIRVCKILKSFYELYIYEKQRYKKYKHEHDEQQHQQQMKKSYFYILNGDQWLMATVKDSQRMVRWEAIQVIDWILSLNKSIAKDDSNKRFNEENDGDEVDSDSQRNRCFLIQLQELNLSHIKQTTQPEYLYQEAFDIIPSMMTQSIEPPDNIDDPNMLDCY
ncbi:unnamed protein product [Cunninghamella blakesleeana]